MICLKINEQLLYCIFSLHGCSDRSATKQLHERIIKNFVQVDRILVNFFNTTPLCGPTSTLEPVFPSVFLTECRGLVHVGALCSP